MTVSAGLTIIIAAFGITGCRTLPTGPDADGDAPTYATIAEAHNERVDRLSQIYSRGVIEIRWRDEDGRHFEQGNLDLWLQLPRHTGLRVEKVGNVFLWLGSNDERFWLFDMLGDETVLLTEGHDSVLQGNGLMTMRPLALLDLAGLTKLPEAIGDADPQLTFDERRDAWVVTAPGQGGMMRMYFDRYRLLPVQVDSLDEAGDVAYRSDIRLARYRSVPRPGAPPSMFGQMPTLIDITATTRPGEAVTRAEIKLALDTPTGRVDNQPMDRVFDLDRLIRSMRPDRIEGDLPTISP